MQCTECGNAAQTAKYGDLRLQTLQKLNVRNRVHPWTVSWVQVSCLRGPMWGDSNPRVRYPWVRVREVFVTLGGVVLGGFGAYRSRLVQGCSAYCTNRVRVGVGCPTHRTPHLPAAANIGSILQRAWLRQHPVTRTPGPAASTVQRCYWAELNGTPTLTANCGLMAHPHSQQINVA